MPRSRRPRTPWRRDRARSGAVRGGYEKVRGVMSAIRRPAVLVASLAVVGGALAACGSGPSQVNSAVIMGDRVISVDDVQHRLDTALSAEPAAKDLAKNRKLDLVSRGIVTQLIRHELVAEAARRENVTVSEKDLSDLTAQAAPSEDPVERSIDAGFDARELARDRLLTQALGKKYLEKLKVTFMGLQVVSNDAKKKSEDVARKVAATPDKAAQIFEQAGGQDAQAIPQFELTAPRGYDIAAQNQVLLTPLFGVAQRSVVAFPLGQGEQAASAGWIVAYIQERSLDSAPSGEQQQQQGTPVAQIPAQWSELVGRQLAAPLATELGVRISPRYGVWDELAVGVAASDGEKFGLVVPPVTAKP